MLQIIQKRYWFFAFSLLIIIPGIVSLSLWGLPLAIDFTGGSKLEVGVYGADELSTSRITDLLDSQGFRDNVVQIADSEVIVIRTKSMDDTQKSDVILALEDEFDVNVELLSFESVGPVIGGEVASRAIQAVLIAAVGILVYISYAFRGVKKSFRYGVCAIFALFHDTIIVLGVASIFGRIFNWEIDALFLTALLTVIGFSVHDSIVVFDRIRENLLKYRRADYEEVVNLSVLQTVDRSINTQLTALFTLLALALFGGSSIFHFVVTMMIGLVSGTYSSLFNAAPILVVWEKREWQRWFGT
ncbi:MAG TPA: protein translocase subunit SecF [Chloroflexi bacterium]|nr:protein translocase subunit SecF [Chloroflexota bacterium]HCU97941.1 protein translocase subunit SecF [Chloroflexota bacterium]|tara:strand:- start:1231 stop:2133 length:903 start_codon:yes stop_codon:yes gene_type:complete